MKLSASMQHYLNAVYELTPAGEGARICDIAAKVGVTKASACTAMKKLQDKQLIYRGAGRQVFLTMAGERQAILMRNKVEIIRRFLIDVLDLRVETADTEACAMERIISAETLCSLCRFTNLTCSDRCNHA